MRLAIRGVPFTLHQLLIALIGVAAVSSTVSAQSTNFTYQGRLANSGAPVSGQYDLQFKLFDTVAVGTGTQQGSTVVVSGVTVTNGLFTASLDFGACPACFNGSSRFLEIAVKTSAGSTFTTLGPRQPLAATPYAIRSSNASASDSLSAGCVNCVTSNQIATSVTTDSASYIHNSTTTQAGSNFKISGRGNADTFDAATEYDIGGSAALKESGFSLAVGHGAGLGSDGLYNVSVGDAGFNLRHGNYNSLFGFLSGNNVVDGNENTLFGASAGYFTSGTASYNAFFGSAAGFDNQSGEGNTAVGYSADMASGGLTNATAIGAYAQVAQSNSLVLGSINGVHSATASTNVGIGTTTPGSLLDVEGNAQQAITAVTSSTVGTWFNLGNSDTGGHTWNLISSGSANGEGAGKLLFRDAGANAVRVVFDTNGNVGIGNSGPADRLQVAGDIRVGTGTTGCVKDADGTVIAGTCSSDARLKRDITPFPPVLDEVVRLQPVHFHWRTDEHPEKGFGASESYGLVAQDVEAALPELVTEDASGFKAVRYSELPLMMLEAIKEQQAEIAREQRHIEALERIVCRDHPDAEGCR